MIDTFIFDINGVLNLPTQSGKKNVLNSFRHTISQLENFGVDYRKIEDDLFEIYRRSSINEITRDKTVNKMAQLMAVEPSQTVSNFHQIYAEGYVENINLYNFLSTIVKTGLLKVALLSTQFPLSKDILVPQKYYDNFDYLEISCDSEIHSKKPAKRVFEIMFKQLDTIPENVIFVDDQQKNVDIGNQIGMYSLLFRNNEQLANHLADLNIPQKVIPYLHLLY